MVDSRVRKTVAAAGRVRDADYWYLRARGSNQKREPFSAFGGMEWLKRTRSKSPLWNWSIPSRMEPADVTLHPADWQTDL
jgi:hypothetical protein